LGENGEMQAIDKYARIERERRFLVREFPTDAEVTRIHRIVDRYIEGTRLRLREQNQKGEPPVFKLAKKVPCLAGGAQQGLITNLYLSEHEFSLLAQLPAKSLSKTRYSVPPFGIDIFEGTLQGLVLAEAEFNSAEAASGLILPSFILREVSADNRFSGGELVRASRQDLQTWLLEHGIKI
jgi:CYTH domain-containing protein